MRSMTAPPAGPAIAPAGTRSNSVSCRRGLDHPAPTQGAGGRSVGADAGVFLKALKQWEGEHPFMYADTRGYVTTGIGHLLKTPEGALKLPWRHSKTGQPATPSGGQVDVRARPPSGGSIQAGPPEREGNPTGSMRETIRSGPAGRFCHQTGDEPPEHGVPPAPARAVSWLRPLPAAGAARDRGHGLQPRCREAQTRVSGLRGGMQSRQLCRCGKGVTSFVVSRGA